MNSRQNAAAQGEMRIGCAALDDKILDERRSRIGLKQPALLREQRFVGRSGAEVEAESVAVRNFRKSPVAVIQLAQPQSVWAIFAFRYPQRQRLRQTSAKSDVDEVRLIQANEQTQVIAQLRIARLNSHDTGADAHHFKAYFLQGPFHHTVHFIAPTATTPADDLLVTRLRIKHQGAVQLHVQIFERDRVLMSSMDGSQRREIRPHAAVKMYPVQISRKFQGTPPNDGD